MPNRNEKPFVFVFMPFSEDFKDVYELGIKAACASVGAECARVDEQIFLESILERIYKQIEIADLIIAEMSDRNANVFYETGYAHGLGKRVILLTRESGDIPFDLRQFPHIIYQDKIRDLRQELERKLRWCIEHPSEGAKPGASGDASLESELELMSKHIMNYLKANGHEMVGFETIRELINPDYSDKLILTLIDRSPEVFRRARLKGGVPGIARLKK